MSHDLHNPLRVAEGQLELAQEECDSERLEAMDEALTRMDSLIEDTLALAKARETIGETKRVDLADLIESCRRTLETASATIKTETDRVIEADETRLKQLMENLLRNAVERGGSEAAITVGDLPDEFYVEDDGPGIPEEARAEVLEPGYSTSEAGTGFGLSIVRDITLAHGWELRIADRDEGGARFEFSGVETG